MVLNKLSETIAFPDGSEVTLGVNQKEDGSVTRTTGDQYLSEFLLQGGLPVWWYVIGETIIEKRVFLLHKQNTVYVTYRLLTGEDKLRLKLQPAVHFCPHDAPIDQRSPDDPYVFSAVENRYQISQEIDMPYCGSYSGGKRHLYPGKRKPSPIFFTGSNTTVGMNRRVNSGAPVIFSR